MEKQKRYVRSVSTRYHFVDGNPKSIEQLTTKAENAYTAGMINVLAPSNFTTENQGKRNSLGILCGNNLEVR
jgi:hypothetical protein